ncbi:putative M-phase phosphoprotein [Helianthus annuus]|nr:putative M-phase phosphoprotein [Helianthus annuus]
MFLFHNYASMFILKSLNVCTCSMVVMEGDPSPGAIRGRMSFQSFNPSIDKLNEEASNPRQSEGDSMCSGNQGGKPSNRIIEPWYQESTI